MGVSGEQIRREQQESSRRSRFGYESQVAAPAPPPWDAIWLEHSRRIRHFQYAFLGFWPAVLATAWLAKFTHIDGKVSFWLITACYSVVLAFFSSRQSLICPRCGYRSSLGRRLQWSCRHCRL